MTCSGTTAGRLPAWLAVVERFKQAPERIGPCRATAARYGIDPVHFGIIVVINIEIGLLTPPLATNLYVASLANRIPLIPLVRQVLWFLLACLFGLFLITYVPQIALWFHVLPGYG